MCGIIAVVRRPGTGRLRHPTTSPGRSTRRSPPWPAGSAGRGLRHRRPAGRAGGRPAARDRGRARARPRPPPARRGRGRVRHPRHDRRRHRGPPRRRHEARPTTPPGPSPRARPAELEAVNAAVIRLKDAVWAVEEDRTRTARAVADLAGSEPGWAATEGYTSIQQALSAIDRLEVRGRDSAGLHVLVHGHGLDVDSPAIARLMRGRASDPLFRSGTVRSSTAACRSSTRPRPRSASWATTPGPCATPCGPTTCCAWRSPPTGGGRRARPHPVGVGRHHQPAQRPPGRQRRGGRRRRPLRRRLPQRRRRQLRRPQGRRRPAHRPRDHHRRQGHPHAGRPALAEGDRPGHAFRNTVASFEGSVAIGARPAPRPTSCCWPCAAAARRSTSAWPTTPTSWPASRTAWSR